METENEQLSYNENDPLDLLKEALYYFNCIPRKNMDSLNTKDSYELAAQIQNYVMNEEYNRNETHSY